VGNRSIAVVYQATSSSPLRQGFHPSLIQATEWHGAGQASCKWQVFKMSRITRFEDIITWQKSKKLCVDCYAFMQNIKDFSFRDQIQRASVSVMNNIAEGYERMGNKEFKKFLYISKGSCGEVRSMLHLALDFGYINEEKFNLLYQDCIEISRMLSGLIKTL
jgi:four helix bundle protein